MRRLLFLLMLFGGLCTACDSRSFDSVKPFLSKIAENAATLVKHFQSSDFKCPNFENIKSVYEKFACPLKKKPDLSGAPDTSKPTKPIDTLILKKGGKIQGTILEETSEKVVIEIEGGTVGFPKSDIAAIRLGEALVKNKSGIEIARKIPVENDGPYPRLYLKNGNIIYGKAITREGDKFIMRQQIEGGGNAYYGFKFDEIEKIRLWPPPGEEELKKSLENLEKLNLKHSYKKPPYAIFSSVDPSDSVLYTNALQTLYDDFSLYFFDWIDTSKPHGALVVVLFGDYNQFLEFSGLKKDTTLQGFYLPDTRILYLYNLKEIDFIHFQLKGAEVTANTSGEIKDGIETAENTGSAEKWVDYDLIEKTENDRKRRHMRLENIARIKTIQTVRHEAARQLMHALDLDGPDFYRGAWFSEGMAGYLEPEEMGSVNTDRLMLLHSELEKGHTLMPLPFLFGFRAEGNVHQKPHPTDTLMAYAESWAFVYYLMNEHKAEFWNYIRDLKSQGKEFNSEKDIQLLEKNLGGKLTSLEGDFEKFVKKIIAEKLDPEEYELYRFFENPPPKR